MVLIKFVVVICSCCGNSMLLFSLKLKYFLGTKDNLGLKEYN